MSPIDPAELREMCQRIINSGALGRSRTYRDILEYLVECSISGDQPKEVAIAVDVLGRDSDFDVGRDSIVRVHLYHLRSKLDSYFERFGQNEEWRLEIPRGQYVLVSVPNVPEVDDSPEPVTAAEPPAYQAWLPWLSGLLALLLVISLFTPSLGSLSPDELQTVRNMDPWQNIMDDRAPILVVVGDYYIFGELDASGSVARMVRDFEINSSDDLQNLMMLQPELYDRYYNLGLSYLPVGTATALASLMPVLYDQSNRVSVRTMSQLGASDLTGNHIIYVGYISGLGILQKLMFSASHLHIGVTYDELFTDDGDSYISDSGILNTREEFRDYGMVSAFTSPRGHQFVLIAGMRDAALMSMAEEISSSEGLQELLSKAGNGKSGWEGLYGVFGYDHTSFDANLIYAGELDANNIWGGE